MDASKPITGTEALRRLREGPKGMDQDKARAEELDKIAFSLRRGDKHASAYASPGRDKKESAKADDDDGESEIEAEDEDPEECAGYEVTRELIPEVNLHEWVYGGYGIGETLRQREEPLDVALAQEGVSTDARYDLGDGAADDETDDETDDEAEDEAGNEADIEAEDEYVALVRLLLAGQQTGQMMADGIVGRVALAREILTSTLDLTPEMRRALGQFMNEYGS